MTPTHHPNDETLLAYAAGTLGEGFSLVIAAHLAFCPDCRAAIAGGEAIGGDLLEQVTPELLAEGARERVLAALGAAPPAAPAAAAQTMLNPQFPAPLNRYLDRDFSTVPWRSLGPGLHHFEILQHHHTDFHNLRLLRIAPGRKLPRHGHSGMELTLVLLGSYSDELGQFARGDVAETDEEIVHQPTSDRDEDCVCLIATDAPLKFESVVARVFQRFAGI
jgi:putative transcriptional regulator